jgi:hypothetical protein
MTVLPILIALTVIVTCTMFIIVTVQRAYTRTATLRRTLREGGPVHTIRYSVIEPAWPIPAPLPGLRKVGESPARKASARNVKAQTIAEAA